MNDYGFNRLVLLNSAGYTRAELPLDGAVSLLAPNNQGKTSLINALQFLLIINRKSMNFGAHDWDKSRKFYFPDNSAYILLEVQLPTGMVVLGCVGKGISHDYEYFAYKGALNITDFALPNGNIVAQIYLQERLAKFGKLVRFYDVATFRALVYGGGKGRAAIDADFNVFRLEHSGYANVFQKVLRSILRLDKLTSDAVKMHLLEIFERDLPDASINFKDEWDHAFAEVNEEQRHYEVALKHQAEIEKMAGWQQEQRRLRGKIGYYQPLLGELLGEWNAYHLNEQERLTQLQKQVEESESTLQQRNREFAKEQLQHQQQRDALLEASKRLDVLQTDFALVINRFELEQALVLTQEQLEEQIRLIGNATIRSPAAIQRERDDVNQRIQQTEQALATLADNLYLRLRELLSPDELDTLNRILNRDVMTLAAAQVKFDGKQAQHLHAYLQEHIQGEMLSMPGIHLPLSLLKPQYSQKTPDELRTELSDLQHQAQDLKDQLRVVQEMEVAKQHKLSLERQQREQEKRIQHFDEMCVLRDGAAERAEQLFLVEGKLDEIQQHLGKLEDEAVRLRLLRRDSDTAFLKLNADNQRVSYLRGKRIDSGPIFTDLFAKAHVVWQGTENIGLGMLADVLQEYLEDCKILREVEESKLYNALLFIQKEGLTKYQYASSAEEEIEKIVEFSHHLPQEKEALEKKAHTAVTAVAATLRQLRQGLNSFVSGVERFNHLIRSRRLSDLKVFKIKSATEDQLVDAIDLIISTSEKSESGDNFLLFNQHSVLDDKKLNQAKILLIEEGQARQGLQVKDLFRLEFVLAKEGQDAESFEEIDSAASNGTVMMAKLLTGLALLNMMLDKRQEVRGICYLDEAAALDKRNQRSLIQTAADFGFNIIFASPEPLVTVRYCVPILTQGGYNIITHRSWQLLEPLTG